MLRKLSGTRPQPHAYGSWAVSLRAATSRMPEAMALLLEMG